MKEQDNIKKFTAEDIEKYHRGLLSAGEKHALERAALDDPFLADALEGYAVAGVDATNDVAELRQRLAERLENQKRAPAALVRRFAFLKVAALLVLLAGAGILTYTLLFNKKEKDIAKLEKTTKEEIKTADSTTPPPSSSTTDNTNNNSGIVKTENPRQQDQPVPDKNNQTAATGGAGNRQFPNDRTEPPRSLSQGEVTPVATNNPKEGEYRVAPQSQPGKTEEKKEIAREDIKSIDDKVTKQKKDPDLSRGQEPQPSGYFKKDIAGADKPAIADEQNNRRLQQNIFRGRVTNANNEAVPYATLVTTRDNRGTYSDANGNFSISSPDSLLDVKVQSVGYENNTSQLRADLVSNNVIMQPSREAVQEVVVTAKGMAKRAPRKLDEESRSRVANEKVTVPEPVDGWEKYDSYLLNNLRVPQDYNPGNANDSTVLVSFEVGKNGKPVNPQIEKSLCGSCDQEAIRLIRQGPTWKRAADKKARTSVRIHF